MRVSKIASAAAAAEYVIFAEVAQPNVKHITGYAAKTAYMAFKF
jgi:hypothetical protein